MTRNIPDLRELEEKLRSEYLLSPRECTAVALASLRHLGKGYCRTRELLPDRIDCSTLVSQAHWEGAGVQTPFIAESQRLAHSATDVPSLDDALPGDVLVSYPSKAHSPDGTFNHVGVLLTKEGDGEGWVIESRVHIGVRVIPLAEMLSDGGIRRFCPNPMVEYAEGEWSRIALLTPKLGRLAARQTAQYGSGRRHRGLDVYVDAADAGAGTGTGTGTGAVALFAPMSGVVATINVGERRRQAVAIKDARRGIVSVVAPVHVSPDIAVGDEVKRGDYIGDLDASRRWIGCNALPSLKGKLPVHWEVWSSADLGYSLTADLEALEKSLAGRDIYRAYNPLYASKLGFVGSPLAPLPS